MSSLLLGWPLHLLVLSFGYIPCLLTITIQIPDPATAESSFVTVGSFLPLLLHVLPQGSFDAQHAPFEKPSILSQTSVRI